MAKLETCVHGLIESQSFSFWALLTIFEYLKDANCVPDDAVFRQLVASMATALNFQAKAFFSAVAFLQQVQRESFVSHLLRSTLVSVRHVLLSTSSTSSLFSEEVSRSLLTQVKDDSQLSLLKNHPSLKGRKQSASTASTSGHRRRDSLSSSPSSHS